jgi:hypothetical protein
MLPGLDLSALCGDAFEIFLSWGISIANLNGMTTCANRPAVELLDDLVAVLTRFEAT